MVFPEYEEYKRQYFETQRIFNSILMEQEELFTRTQPNAIRYDTDHIQTSPSNSQFDNYLAQKEKRRIDERLKEAKTLLEEREYILQKKEDELRQSMDIKDIIYLYKFVDGMHADKIAKKLNYSVSQIYRYIQIIEEYIRIIEDATKCEKNGAIIRA